MIRIFVFCYLLISAFSLNAQCVDSSQINLDVMCPMVYDPVCGCNGITYGNSCEAFNWGGVTTWTIGPCNSQVEFADTCTNLAGIDFGLCTQFLGYGLINGVCTPISGCNFLLNNIDYSTALSPTLEDCQMNCTTFENVPSCTDLSMVDFGACTMPLGYGIVNNQCEMISGCSSIIGNLNYSLALSSSLDSCISCLPSQISENEKYIIEISPNPFIDKVTFNLKSSLIKYVYIFDLQGNNKNIFNLDLGISVLSFSDLASGFYYAAFVDQNRSIIHIQKIIKE